MQNTSRFKVEAALPANRNYTVVMWNEQETPPRVRQVGNVSAYNNNLVIVQMNFTTQLFNIYGFLNVTGSSAEGCYNLFNYMYISSMVPSDTRQSPLPTDTFNKTTCFYNLSLPGPGIDYLIAAYANTTNEYFGAFGKVTLDANTQLNLNLTGLAGNYTNTSYLNTSMNAFNFISATDNGSAGRAHIEVFVNYSGTAIRWFVEGDRSTGAIKIPLLNSSSATLKVFSQDAAPREIKYTGLYLVQNPIINITLRGFDMHEPNGTTGGLMSKVKIEFFKSNSSCDIPSPSGACLVSNFSNAAEFDPMKALLGGAISIRMTQTDTNVIVHYVNVDLIASGPPDAVYNDEAHADKSSGSTIDQVWRFGSLGPKVYDRVLI
ncbi:MAG: hypothetical protein AABX59_01040, partial [Nanoarchaeota archaeon]